MNFITRLLITSLALGVTASLVPGIHIAHWWTLVIAAFVLGIVNAIVRPILIILTLPLTVFSLGLFLLVINALTLMLVSVIVPGFKIDGFGSALLGWLVTWIVGWAASAIFVGKERR